MSDDIREVIRKAIGLDPAFADAYGKWQSELSSSWLAVAPDAPPQVPNHWFRWGDALVTRAREIVQQSANTGETE
jgi:hypothetical protein